jgi:hypothetical protein
MRRGRSANAIKIDLQGALGGVQNHPAVLTLVEVPTKRHNAMGG